MELGSATRRQIDRVAGAIRKSAAKPLPNEPGVKLTWGVVSALNTGPPLSLDVKIEGSASANTKVRYLSSYSPTVGDTVMCTWHGRDLVVVGAMAPTGGGSGYASLTGAGETATPGALVQAGPFTVENTAAFGSGTGIDLKDTGDAGILITNNGTNITYAGAGICIDDPDMYGVTIVTGANPYTGSPPQGSQTIDIINSQLGLPVMLFEGGNSGAINLVATHAKIQIQDDSSGITIAADSSGPLTIESQNQIIIENTNPAAAGIYITDAGTGAASGMSITAADGGNGIYINANLLRITQRPDHSHPTAPPYVLGAMYFDTGLNKLRIGGATGWETVTSA